MTTKNRVEVPNAKNAGTPSVHVPGHLFVKAVAETVVSLISSGVKYYVEGKAYASANKDDALFIPLGKESLTRLEDGAILVGGDKVRSATCFDQRTQRLVKLVFEWKRVLQANNDAISRNKAYLEAKAECTRNLGHQIGTTLPIRSKVPAMAAVIGDMVTVEFCVFQVGPDDAVVRYYSKMYNLTVRAEAGALFERCLRWLTTAEHTQLSKVFEPHPCLSAIARVIAASECVVLQLGRDHTKEIAKVAVPIVSARMRFDREVGVVRELSNKQPPTWFILPSVEKRFGLDALVYNDDGFVAVGMKVQELLGAVVDDATRAANLTAVAKGVWVDIKKAHDYMHSVGFVFVDNHEGNYLVRARDDGAYRARLCDFESTCKVNDVVRRAAASTTSNATTTTTEGATTAEGAKVFIRKSFAPLDYSKKESAAIAKPVYDDESRLYVVAYIIDYEDFRSKINKDQMGESDQGRDTWAAKKQTVSTNKDEILQSIGVAVDRTRNAQ